MHPEIEELFSQHLGLQCFFYTSVSFAGVGSKKIKNAKEVLRQILSGRVRYDFIRDHPINNDSHNTSWRSQSTSFIDVSEVRGWDMDNMETIIEKLMSVDGSERLSLQVVSLIGVGGIGKTTLAQLTYNDARVQEYFELKFWICVSHSIDAAEIAKGILKDACPRRGQLDSMLESLKEISERKFILVLDNVWEVNLSQWDTLKNILRFGCHGSKVLLTTRNKRVARMLDCLQEDIQDIGVFPGEDCWQILSSIAFFGRRAWGYLGSDRGDGSMELRGREYFNSLTMLSFFQVEEVDGKVHMVERGKLPRGKKEDKY